MNFILAKKCGNCAVNLAGFLLFVTALNYFDYDNKYKKMGH